jgi:hypothetical protein
MKWALATLVVAMASSLASGPSPCSNAGVLAAGSCVCFEGRAGRHCEHSTELWQQLQRLDHKYFLSQAFQTRLAVAASFLADKCPHVLEVGSFKTPLSSFFPPKNSLLSFTALDPLTPPLVSDTLFDKLTLIRHIPSDIAAFSPLGVETCVAAIGLDPIRPDGSSACRDFDDLLASLRHLAHVVIEYAVGYTPAEICLTSLASLRQFAPKTLTELDLSNPPHGDLSNSWRPDGLTRRRIIAYTASGLVPPAPRWADFVISLVKSGDSPRALRWVYSAMATNISTGEIFDATMALHADGASREALRILKILLEERGPHPLIFNSAGLILLGLGDQKAAEQLFETARFHFREDPLLQRNHAVVLLSRGPSPEAAALLTRSLPTDAATWDDATVDAAVVGAAAWQEVGDTDQGGGVGEQLRSISWRWVPRYLNSWSNEDFGKQVEEEGRYFERSRAGGLFEALRLAEADAFVIGERQLDGLRTQQMTGYNKLNFAYGSTLMHTFDKAVGFIEKRMGSGGGKWVVLGSSLGWFCFFAGAVKGQSCRGYDILCSQTNFSRQIAVKFELDVNLCFTVFTQSGFVSMR